MAASTLYVIGAIAVMGAATFATRALPFFALSRHTAHPLVRHLGRTLPPAVMLMLVIYSLRGIPEASAGLALSQIAAVAVTALLHVFLRQPLVSIAGGTGCYMLLLRLVGG